MLHRIQLAHYVEGRRIADTPVLTVLAADIGLNTEAFINAFNIAQNMLHNILRKAEPC